MKYPENGERFFAFFYFSREKKWVPPPPSPNPTGDQMANKTGALQKADGGLNA